MIDHPTALAQVNDLIARLLGSDPTPDGLIALAEILTTRADELAEEAAQALWEAAQFN